MRSRWLLLLTCLLAQNVMAQQSDASLPDAKHYVSDELYIFMHTGPSRNYRILGSINAGEPITVLDTSADGSFTQVVDGEERTGWIESEYVTDSVSRRFLLPQAEQQLQQTQDSLEAAMSQSNNMSAQFEQAQSQIKALQNQLAEANKQLEDTQALVESQDQSELFNWLTRGGLIAGCGVILGVILTIALPKRRRRDNWM